MAEWVQRLATQPEDLSKIPRHLLMKGEKQSLLVALLTSTHELCYTPPQTK